MLSSVQAGFRALPAGARAAVIMLGDQPFLAAGVVDAVIAAYEESGRGLVIPTFGGRRGHPVLIDLKFRDEVLGLDQADGLRRLMRPTPGTSARSRPETPTSSAIWTPPRITPAFPNRTERPVKKGPKEGTWSSHLWSPHLKMRRPGPFFLN